MSEKLSMKLPRRDVLKFGAALASMGIGGDLFSSAQASSASPQAGGTLRLAVPGGSADSLDPHRTQAQVSDIVRFTNLFDGLCDTAPDGTVKLSMAESIEPDGDTKRWIVKLRQGIKTHDGPTYTADDLIFSIARILDDSVPTKGASLIKFIDPANMEKVDELTVAFNLTKPIGVFREVWANVFLRMVPRDFDAQKPNGTGPFRYEAFVPAQESTFVRFDDYYREKAWVEKLIVSVINDNIAAVNALRGDQVDICYTMPFAEARTLGSDSDLRVLINPTPLQIPIYMRTDVAPFDDVRVRQALRLIANRRQLVAVALAGNGVVANDMIGRDLAPCTAEQPGQREQNIEEAKRLLADAGRSDLSLEMVTVNGTAGMVECAQVYAQQAQAAGVTISVRTMEVGAYLDKYLEWPFGVDFLSDPFLDVVGYSMLSGGNFNVTHWNDEEYTALYEMALGTADQAERCRIIDKLRKIEFERGGNIIWGFANTLNGYRDRVQGMVPYTVDSIIYNLRAVWLA